MFIRTVLAVGLLFFVLGLACVRAEDVFVLNRSGHGVISGTVTKVEGESVFIDNGGRPVEIRLDDLDIDDVEKVFPPGTTITAQGRFKEEGTTPVFEATGIGTGQSPDGLTVPEALILNNRINKR